MSLFAAWTSVVLAAARIDPPVASPPTVPEPRRFRLAYNPVPAPAPARRLVAEEAPASARTPMALQDRLCLEK
ncbi:hypothetical protein [Azospirillum lipoferum]|uniref:Uncharacterized protein n=1 Tax=Azospirillum lipoferum (strain 4B) TaxID=862719 RepID=G7Z7V5_AZOL4|nr:hypothetical protein [Azospirillum lipoferum]CBS85533.1 protein of unknown function [Azospirillum lipoferum 4B]